MHCQNAYLMKAGITGGNSSTGHCLILSLIIYGWGGHYLHSRFVAARKLLLNFTFDFKLTK